MTIRDIDRGAKELTKRLADLERAGSIKISVGVHPDDGAAPHPSGGTVAEVAGFVELGTNKMAPSGFVRESVDQNRAELSQAIVDAGTRVLEGETIGDAFGSVARDLADKMRAKVPVDTGRVKQAISARVNGERV